MFSITNPYNLTILSEHQYITDIEVSEKLNFSSKIWIKWSNYHLEERIKFIKSLIFALTKQQHLLAKTCTLEMGKPIKQALTEVKKCSLLCEYYLKNAEAHLNPVVIETDASDSFVTYEPLGVILGVMPWNFPYWQVFRFAIPAIIAGNTVVVKHASNVAGCGKLLEKLFLDAGFPEGVYQNLLISGGQVENVINNPILKRYRLQVAKRQELLLLLLLLKI